MEEIERMTEKLQNSVRIKILKPFGYDLFNGVQTKPLMIDSPIPAKYGIGSGDLIEIQLFGQRNESYGLEFQEGFISFSEIGPINAFENGTSFVDLKNLLKQKITIN